MIGLGIATEYAPIRDVILIFGALVAVSVLAAVHAVRANLVIGTRDASAHTSSEYEAIPGARIRPAGKWVTLRSVRR